MKIALVLLVTLVCGSSGAWATADMVDVYRRLPATLFTAPEQRMELLKSPATIVDAKNEYLAVPDLQLTLFEQRQGRRIIGVTTGSQPGEEQTLHFYTDAMEDVTTELLPWPYDRRLRYTMPRVGVIIPVTDAHGVHVFDMNWQKGTFRIIDLTAVLVQPVDTDIFDTELNAAVNPLAHGVYPLPTVIGVDHHWAFSRGNFDAGAITLHWHDRWETTQGALATAVQAGIMVRLSKTVRLNVRPAGSTAYVEVPDQPEAVPLAVDGRVLRVRPLRQVDDAVVVPWAWEPPDIYLVHERFATFRLHIAPGALDTFAAVYPQTPIDLQPLYGWFSYPLFDLGLALSAIIFPGVLWLRRRHPPKIQGRDTEPRSSISTIGVRYRVPETPPDETLLGESGKRYVLGERLGSGGMGTVFEAHTVDSGTLVAIKVMHDDDNPGLRARFAREIRMCARLQHPNIVRVLDWGPAFMVMERIPGQTLRQMLNHRPGPWPPHTVVLWLKEALQGLQAAHALGIVHRDLQPANLMMADGHVKLMDFGLARDASEDPLTRTGALFGTPHYMSPEHLNAKTAGPRSDIYSLGVIGYRLLTGQTPFPDETDVWGIVTKVLLGMAPPMTSLNAAIPAELAAVIAHMMALDPKNRYADAEAAWAALNTLPPL